MSSNLKGSKILQILDSLNPDPLSEDIQDLYNAAYENMSTNPEKAIEFGHKALVALDRLSSIPLGDSNALAYANGRCHLLIASIYLDHEMNLERAEHHYLSSRNAFHSRQWSHLESLACLAQAIVLRQLKDLRKALITCKSAQDCVEHESIPDKIDITSLRKAIEEERLKIQELLLEEFSSILIQIPIVSHIAAGLGQIAEENIEEYLPLEKDEYKNADFGVKVVGNSMSGHHILPGDIALIRQTPKVETGEIAAVVIITPEREPVGVLKQYYAYEEDRADIRHWFLKSNNPGSEHLVVTPQGANVNAIRALYTKARQTGRIRNPVEYYENAELAIAGKYVGSVTRESTIIS